MPVLPLEHWAYTIREWTNHPFTQITDALPKDIKVMYDIGANVGGFSYVIKQKYPDIHIEAFEPVERNYEALCKYMPDVVSHKVGIFYGQTSSRVMCRGDSNCGAFFVEHIVAGEPQVTNGEIMELVELEKLDLPKPDLIKMDVEGAEENIIEFSEIVHKCPNLIIEWHPSLDPIAFFTKHLPDHKIVVNLDNKQFYLCL